MSGFQRYVSVQIRSSSICAVPVRYMGTETDTDKRKRNAGTKRNYIHSLTTTDDRIDTHPTQLKFTQHQRRPCVLSVDRRLSAVGVGRARPKVCWPTAPRHRITDILTVWHASKCRTVHSHSHAQWKCARKFSVRGMLTPRSRYMRWKAKHTGLKRITE